MLRGCIESSLIVAFVSFRYNIIGYKLPAIGLGQSPAHRRSFFVRHDIYSRTTGLYLARVLCQLLLVLFRPRACGFQHRVELFFCHVTSIHSLSAPGYFPSFSTSRTGVSGVTPPRRRAKVSWPLFSHSPATARRANTSQASDQSPSE
jgi:hypothetical protein